MAPNTSRHLDAEDVERYSLGLAPEEEAAHFEEHLLICQACRDRIVECDQTAAGFQQASARIRRQGVIEIAPRRSLWPALLAAAAMIAVLALITWSRSTTRLPAAVTLTAMRGGELLAHAPAGAPLRFDPDTTGLPASPSYRLEMVDAVGHKVWSGVSPGPPAPPQRKGTYFVRISIGAGDVLREYGLKVE
jgi:hypothetical protein